MAVDSVALGPDARGLLMHKVCLTNESGRTLRLVRVTAYASNSERTGSQRDYVRPLVVRTAAPSSTGGSRPPGRPTW